MNIKTLLVNAKRKIVFFAARKRAFWMLGMLSVGNEFIFALVATYKLLNPELANISLWILRLGAAVAWILCIVQALSNTHSFKHWKIYKSITRRE